MDEEATGQDLVDEEEVYLLLRKEMHLTDNMRRALTHQTYLDLILLILH